MEAEMSRLLTAVGRWRELNTEIQEKAQEVNAARAALADLGIHMTLDDFDAVSADLTSQVASAPIPALMDRREMLTTDGEEEIGNDEETQVSPDRRSAAQIRKEAIPEVADDADEVSRFATSVGGQFERAISAGFASSSRLAPFMPGSEGEVRTVGLGG